MKHFAHSLALAAGIAALALPAACTNNEPAEQRNVMMSVETSSREILAGEIVTLTARTENTLGRDAVVKWSSNGGEIKTEDKGGTARVTFKKPGMYTVTARLFVDDRVMREDSVDIRVKPVN